jgi:hypothetical protein
LLPERLRTHLKKSSTISRRRPPETKPVPKPRARRPNIRSGAHAGRALGFCQWCGGDARWEARRFRVKRPHAEGMGPGEWPGVAVVRRPLRFCLWSTGRIVQAFHGQWNVEELFRRAKKGGVVPWGPSHQWADGSIRLHTFATVLGLMLVSLAKIALGTGDSALATMDDLAATPMHSAPQYQIGAWTGRTGEPSAREPQPGDGRWSSNCAPRISRCEPYQV